MWSHLGQVTGGSPVGVGTRGPGEQQLEIDRRIVSRRLVALRRELEDVQTRKAREVESRRSEHFTVGIVGYTNAGKSTLFNALTAGGAYAADKLFATLITRVERWNVGGANAVLLSDTVGFIRDLPHHLVASFRATLEDAIHAHALLIVLDASAVAAYTGAAQQSHGAVEFLLNIIPDTVAGAFARGMLRDLSGQDDGEGLRTMTEVARAFAWLPSAERTVIHSHFATGRGA